MELHVSIERIMSKIDGDGPDKVKELYVNDPVFKADMDFVKKHIEEVFVPLVRAVIEAALSIIETLREQLLKLNDEQRALLGCDDTPAQLGFVSPTPTIDVKMGGQGSMKGATMSTMHKQLLRGAEK
ncbi:hypothetical protein [Listeria cornellensis]|uniref:Uncharacterized protein n=1 Tax=Listeria cornellensis FSL F6-0969 TaxID=1265820 RepID=W7BJT7_9LIST|nr:hypothetical protein [Listeria cornellensis]EUJ27334.1 hypothetical protein PCORN_13432 [Listeria cornellensis FSL F6-0969]